MSAAQARQLLDTARRLLLVGDREGARRMVELALSLAPALTEARELWSTLGPGLPWPTPAPFGDFGEQAPSGRTLPFAGTPPPPVGQGASGRTIPFAASAATGWDTAPAQAQVVPEPSGSGDSDAFQMVAPSHPHYTPVPWSRPPGGGRVGPLLARVRERLELDDHSGAMELLEQAEALAPDNADVRRLRESSERTLMAMLESKLGDLQACPRVRMRPDEIRWLNLDHRAGFVLAQIDGTVSYEDLFAVSGMSRLDTARILAQLVQQKVIG